MTERGRLKPTPGCSAKEEKEWQKDVCAYLLLQLDLQWQENNSDLAMPIVHCEIPAPPPEKCLHEIAKYLHYITQCHIFTAEMIQMQHEKHTECTLFNTQTRAVFCSQWSVITLTEVHNYYKSQGLNLKSWWYVIASLKQLSQTEWVLPEDRYRFQSPKCHFIIKLGQWIMYRKLY